MEAWERIEFLIDYYDLNKNSFSNEIGLNNNVTIGAIIKNKRKPSKKVIELILERFREVNRDWLVTGRGDKFRRDAGGNTQLGDSNINANNSRITQGNENYKTLLNEKDRRIKDLENQVEFLKKLIIDKK